MQVFSRMSLAELEALISWQEKMASGADPEKEKSPDHGGVLEARLGEKRCPEPGTDRPRPPGSLGLFFFFCPEVKLACWEC